MGMGCLALASRDVSAGSAPEVRASEGWNQHAAAIRSGAFLGAFLGRALRRGASYRRNLLSLGRLLASPERLELPT